MNLFRSILAGLALLAASTVGAEAQCGPTAQPNMVCGNNTGSAGLATWVTVSPGVLTPIGGGTVLGNPAGGSATPIATRAPVLGVPGSTTGQVGLAGVTSGTAILRAQAAAGSGISLLPTSGGTLVGTASSPLAIDPVAGLVSCPTCVTSSGGGAITGVAPVAVSGAGAVSLQGLAGGVLAGAGPGFTLTPVLGVNGVGAGTLGLAGATSGTVTLAPQAAAGTVTLTLPTTTGTLVSGATAPLSINAATGVISLATPLTPTFGGSGANLSATGGANQIVQQATLGGAFSVGTMATTINGTVCTLGTACSPTAVASAITVGTTTVNGGPGLLYNASAGGALTAAVGGNNGVLVTSGTGVPSVSTTLPSGLAATNMALTTPSLGVATGTSLALNGCSLLGSALCANGSLFITSTSTLALAVGATGSTNPVLKVDASTASQASGLRILGGATGVGAFLDVIDSGANAPLIINAKGSGTIQIGGTSTGQVQLGAGGGGVQLSGTLSGTAFGTNVATALGTATGAVNGLPRIIATGTIALGTSAIAAGACGTATTASATNALTTDVIDVGFNADPTAVTGYTPGQMLTLVVFPTANTVNVKQCNLTTASVTPGALSLNWWVRR